MNVASECSARTAFTVNAVRAERSLSPQIPPFAVGRSGEAGCPIAPVRPGEPVPTKEVTTQWCAYFPSAVCYYHTLPRSAACSVVPQDHLCASMRSEPHPSAHQAFVPKVHNRETPVANIPVAQRSTQGMHMRHQQSLSRMVPRVTTRWGESWNGVRDQKHPTYSHVRDNLKRAQIQDERFAAIELENNVLLGKLGKILRRSHNPTIGTRDWMGGMRLTHNQVPVIDHWISRDTTQFGAAVEPSSLNLSLRRARRVQIEVENKALVARLQTSKPTYDRRRFEVDARDRDLWMQSHSKEPRLLPPLLDGDRPHSASTSDAVGGGMAGVSSRKSVSAGTFGRSPLRGGSSRRAKLPLQRKEASPIDPSLLKVLDLLSLTLTSRVVSLSLFNPLPSHSPPLNEGA